MHINTDNGMQVRHVFFNGKKWTDATPWDIRFIDGRPVRIPRESGHNIAVRRDSRQEWPMVFGTHLMAVKRRFAPHLDNLHN